MAYGLTRPDWHHSIGYILEIKSMCAHIDDPVQYRCENKKDEHWNNDTRSGDDLPLKEQQAENERPNGKGERIEKQ